MLNFYVTYNFPDKEARDGFAAEIQAAKIAETSRAEAGCFRYQYFFPMENDKQIFLWEQWENAEAQKAHTKQPHFAAIGQIKGRYWAETEVETAATTKNKVED